MRVSSLILYRGIEDRNGHFDEGCFFRGSHPVTSHIRGLETRGLCTMNIKVAPFFEQTMGIYFDDLDLYKVLHNARYLLLFERTLGEFWAELGLGKLQCSESLEHFHLVCHNSVDYLAPVTGVCNVRVRVQIENLGRSSLTFAFRLLPLDRDYDHARARRTVVHVDPVTMKATPWSRDFRQRLAPWLAPSLRARTDTQMLADMADMAELAEMA